MAQQKIYLSKVRDFGENLGDTFQFIRQEFKPLFRSFILIAGAFILGTAVLNGFLQGRIWSIFGKIGKPSENVPTNEILSIFSSTYFLFVAVFFICILSMNLSVACYMKLYNQRLISPTLEDVWNEFKRKFFPSLFLALIVFIILVICTFICMLPVVFLASISPFFTISVLIFILPVIYIGTVLIPTLMIFVNESVSISEAIRRSFTLLKGSFWVSFGIYFVSYIIYSFAAGIIGLILGIFVGVGSYLTTKNLGSTMSMISSVTSVFSYMFYIVFAISVGLNYFSLAEKHDGFGMMQRLETLGSDSPNDTIEEQY